MKRKPPAQDSELRRRWHELQVSQIELELQHAALQRLQDEKAAAESGLEHYSVLYDQAPACYYSVDEDGAIVRANQAAAALAGLPREALLGKRYEQFVAPQQQTRWRGFLAALFAGGGHRVLELQLFERAAADGCGRRVRIEANLDGEAAQCRMIVTDISSEDARDLERRRAQLVWEHMGEGVMITDADQAIVAVNPAFTRLTGYPAEEVLGRDAAFLPDGQASFAARVALALRRSGRWQGEAEYLRRDGGRFTAALSVTAAHAPDGSLLHHITVFSDITARKLAEGALRTLSRDLDARVATRTAELSAANERLRSEMAERERAQAELHASREQLRRLARHMEQVKESERRRIARDIHDQLGQSLLAMRIDLSLLRERTGARHPRLHERTGAMLEQVDGALRSVRGIMNALRPAVLDLGLEAAIEWQVQQFRSRSGLACSLALPAPGTLDHVGAEGQIALFRSLQEALANVLQHARATRVEVVLEADGGGVMLSVRDDGVGIAPQERDKPGCFGLIGMAERAAAQGGGCQAARRAPGGGTVVTIWLAA
ncbi:PAS domain S-box protein [Oxalobacteraceae bacterium A2-2]